MEKKSKSNLKTTILPPPIKSLTQAKMDAKIIRYKADEETRYSSGAKG